MRVGILFSLILALALSGCAKEYASVDESAGVGRYQSAETMAADSGDAPIDPAETESAAETEAAAETTSAPETEPSGENVATVGSGAITYQFVNGKYVYTFPERDTSGLANVSQMETFSRAMFEDQPDDWFFGKTTRDEGTGTVTYVWERYKSTLDILKKYGAIYRGDETEKVVYLTFDNGYENGTTAQILDILKEKNVPATFFVNGHYVESAPHLIRRMLDEGHIIGNHCVNHYDLTEVSVDTFIKEVQGLEDIYYATFPDAPPMVYFRPPSGNSNEWVLKLADMMGYTTVMWSWAYGDYDTNNQPPVSTALQKVKDGLHNGCVYLLHPESTTNVAMLGEMVDWIRSQGYEFMPLPAIETN